MQFTSEQRIFAFTNYLNTRGFKEAQQFYEQLFRDRVSPTKITIWKVQDRGIKFEGEENIHRKILFFFKESLSNIQEYQPDRMVWTLVKVHSTESLNAI